MVFPFSSRRGGSQSQLTLTLSVFGISNNTNPCHNGFLPADEESENVPFRID
jgi:hypothetical protein